MVPLLQQLYNLSFPTHLSHPRRHAHSFLYNPSFAPLLFQGSRNRSDKKSLSPATNAQITREQFPAKLLLGDNSHGIHNPSLQKQISDQERLLTGLTTHLFNSKSYVKKHENPYNIFCR
jgi:hypothetical protein